LIVELVEYLIPAIVIKFGKSTFDSQVGFGTKLICLNFDKKYVRTITPFGTSAKADVPRRYIGRRAYVIIAKD